MGDDASGARHVRLIFVRRAVGAILAMLGLCAAAPAAAATCGFPDRIGVLNPNEAAIVEAQLKRALSDGGLKTAAVGGRVLKQMFFDLPGEIDLADRRPIQPVGDYVVIEKIMGISIDCRVTAAFSRDAGRRQPVVEPYNLVVERQANSDAPFERVGVFRQGLPGGLPGPGRYRLTVEPIGVVSPFNIAAPTRFVTVTSPGLKRTAGILQVQIKNPASSGVVGTGFVIGGKVQGDGLNRSHCTPVSFDAEVKVGEITSETNSAVFSRNTRIERYGNAIWELQKAGQTLARAGPQGSFRFDPLTLGDGVYQLFAALDEADQGKGPSAFRPKAARHVIQVLKCGGGDQQAVQANAEQAAADAAAGRGPPPLKPTGAIVDGLAPGQEGAPDAGGPAPGPGDADKAAADAEAAADAKAAVEQEFELELDALDDVLEGVAEGVEVAALDPNNEIVADAVLEASRFSGDPPPPPRDDIVVPDTCEGCEAEIARHRRLLRTSCAPAMKEIIGFFEDIAKYDAAERAIEADHFLAVLEPLKKFREPQMQAVGRFQEIIAFSITDLDALQSNDAQKIFASAQTAALQRDEARRARNPDAIFIPPMIGGLIERRFADGIFAFGDMSGVFEAKGLFTEAVANFQATQGEQLEAEVDAFIQNDLKAYNERFAERLLELLRIKDGYEARRQRLAGLFRSGEMEHCLGGPPGDDRALQAVPGMNFVLPEHPDRGVDADTFRAAAILPSVLETAVSGFEDFFPVRFKLDGDERQEFEASLRRKIERVEGLGTLVAIEGAAVVLGDFLLAFADTATGKLFLSDNERVQRFNEGLANLTPAIATVLADFFGARPGRLDRAFEELNLPPGAELTARQKLDLLKAHPDVSVRTAVAALDLFIIQPATQIGEAAGILAAQSIRGETESLEEEIFRFQLERTEQAEITEGAIELGALAFDLGLGKLAIKASKGAITIGERVFGSVQEAVAELNDLRRARGLGVLDEGVELTLRGAQEVAGKADEIALAQRANVALTQRAKDLAQQSATATVTDVIIDGALNLGELTDDAKGVLADIVARAKAQADALSAQADAIEVAAKQVDDVAGDAGGQAAKQADVRQPADNAQAEQPDAPPPAIDEAANPPANPPGDGIIADAGKQAEAEQALRDLFGDDLDGPTPPANDGIIADAGKQAEAEQALRDIFGDNADGSNPANQPNPPPPVPAPANAANPIAIAKATLDEAKQAIDDAAEQAQKASLEAAERLKAIEAENAIAEPLPKARVDDATVDLDPALVKSLQENPASLFGRGTEGEVLKLPNPDGSVDALKLINQVKGADGAFDPDLAKKVAEDAIETGKRLEIAGANLQPIKGQGTVKAALPDGSVADVPFLVVEAFPPGTKELAKFVIPDPNRAGKTILGKLTREQQIELLRQFDLAVNEGLVLLDSNPGNLLLNGGPGKVTAGFGETGGFFDALDPRTARAVQAERLFGSQNELASLTQSQLQANRIARELGAPKLNISEIAGTTPRGGQGLLDQFDPDLIAAFKDPDAFKQLVSTFDAVDKPALAAADAKAVAALQQAATETAESLDEVLKTRDALGDIARRLNDPDIPVVAQPVNAGEIAARLSQIDAALNAKRAAVLDDAAKQIEAGKNLQEAEALVAAANSGAGDGAAAAAAAAAKAAKEALDALKASVDRNAADLLALGDEQQALLRQAQDLVNADTQATLARAQQTANESTVVTEPKKIGGFGQVNAPGDGQ